MTNPDLAAQYQTELAAIETAQDRLLNSCMEIMQPSGPVYMPDLFVLGALKRGMSLCAGFRDVFVQDNFTCAAMILRSQVDTASRLYALQYVADRSEFAGKLISGEKFTRLKDRDGNPLKDFYLIKKLAQIAPWVTAVYERTSDFVHLTGSHFFSTVTNLNEEQEGSDYVLRVAVGAKDPPQRPHVYEEILAAFLDATGTVERVARLYLDERARGVAELPADWEERSRAATPPPELPKEP